MSIISPYSSFLKEGLDDEVSKPIKREKKLSRLFFSPAFKNILQNIINAGDFQSRQIANYLLNIDQQDVNKFDISYLNINKEKPEFITSLAVQKVWKEMGWETQEEADIPPSENSPIWNLKAQDNRIIPLITKITDDTFQPSAVEKFALKYRAEVQNLTQNDKFKLVSGEDIRYWYAARNYFKDPSGRDGGLPGSCMRYDGSENDKNCQSYLDIYCKNPDKCSLLILTNDDNKLIGRALVWKGLRKPYDEQTKKPTKWLMDRIYTNKASDYELFKKYAISKGWLYKPEQTAQCDSYVENGQRINKSMSIVVNAQEYKKYPYMDTFRYYNPTTGRLGSQPGNAVIITDENGKQKKARRITITSTDGGFGYID